MGAGGRLCLIVALLFAGCTMDGDEHPPGTGGEEMYGQYCAGCHGSSGEGRFLLGVPSNRSTRLGASALADRILEVGRHDEHRRMPTFPKLKRSEALAIARHVLHLRDQSKGERSFWEKGIPSAAPAAEAGP